MGDSYAKLRGMQTPMPAGPRWYVISLRPRGMHAPLRRAARAAGHGFVALSPWRAVVRDDATTRAALADAYAASIVVFTSPVAVAAACAIAAPPASLRSLAVGAGTARALRRAGVAHVEHPARMDSDGLLALAALDDVDGRTIGLVTAPGGRDAIAPALATRGATVRRADVYAREACAPSPRALRTLRAAPPPWAVAASSAEALVHVLAQVDEPLAARLRGSRVLAASARIANAARAAGFDDVVVADGPRPADLIAALATSA